MDDSHVSAATLDDLLEREWLVTNQVGGYASSTVPSLNTRKYHGLLVAAMAPPVRRLVLLSRVEEVVHCDGWPTPLACNEYPGTVHPNGHQVLRAFSQEPFPRWAYQGEGWAIEKSLQLMRGENTVVLTYTLLIGTKPVELELRPLLALRPMHELMYQWNGNLGATEKIGDKSPGYTAGTQWRIPPTSRTPEVFFAHDGGFDATAAAWYFNTIYRREQERGYAGLEDLWSPGVVKWSLKPGESVHFVCSADPIDLAKTIALAEAEAERSDIAATIAGPAALATRDTDHDLLLRAARPFMLELPKDLAEKTPAGVMTRFPWSPPSVRDALIAMPGLLLVTGRFDLAKQVLLGLAARLHNGLIPSEFPEDGSVPLYNAADTSLWFINAVWQYVRYSGDESTAAKLLPAIDQIIRACHHGGEPGLCAGEDKLLAVRAPGRAATWMDAKVGDWIVTPRAGTCVEINALWYNAVRIALELGERVGQRPPVQTRELAALGDAIFASFNARFWNEREHCCFDVIDQHGNDPSIRPNQLLAIGLPFAVLDARRHADALDRVRLDLLTPLGPRTLSPRDPAYQGRYGGDVVSRDRACHQGCVHPWLLGAMVSAQVRVFGRGNQSRAECRRMLEGCLQHLRRAGQGQLCELFDGDPPHRPGGAIACAASVGELLRCYVEDVLDQSPRPLPRAVQTPEMPVVVANKNVAAKR